MRYVLFHIPFTIRRISLLFTTLLQSSILSADSKESFDSYTKPCRQTKWIDHSVQLIDTTHEGNSCKVVHIVNVKNKTQN